MTQKMDHFSQEGFGMEQQWVYWVETITPCLLGSEQCKLTDINKALNESGRIGWELVGVIQTKPQELLAFYKRKLTIQANPPGGLAGRAVSRVHFLRVMKASTSSNRSLSRTSNLR
jgi:hypothetical protein